MPTNRLNPIYALPEHVHPYVRVCYDIAENAHAFDNQQRNKADGVKLDYITHPSAALNILLIAGEQDPVVLGAALLHDVLEDCQGYLQSAANERGLADQPPFANLLTELLYDGLEAQAKTGALYKPAAHWMGDASSIVQLVKELSAPPKLGKTKRIKRALSAMDYSEGAAKIKIAELAASLADDIMTPPDRSLQAQLEYNDYVWAVAKSAAHISDSQPSRQRNTHITSLFKLVRHLHEEHRVLCDAPQVQLDEAAKAQKREGFSLSGAWARAQGLPDMPKAQPASLYVEHPQIEQLSRGITHVGLTDEGMVSRLRIIFDYDSEHMDEHYALINRLTKLIEGADAGNAVTYGRSGKRTPMSGHHQIKLKLVKPIPISLFCELAAQAGAIDPAKDANFYDSLEPLAAFYHNPKDKGAQQQWAERIKQQALASSPQRL